jgi:hypothetical protein
MHVDSWNSHKLIRQLFLKSWSPARSSTLRGPGVVGERLVKSPKVYVHDSSIVHALLSLETQDDGLGRPVCGARF